MDQGIKMILYYRQHPCQAAYDLLGADLAPIQRPMFRDMWNKNFVMGICGRGGGKTFLLGLIATLSCLLFPGFRAGLISGVFRQSKMIFAEVEKFYSQSSIFREACEKRPIRGTDTAFGTKKQTYTFGVGNRWRF
jgi:hypothetical protein